MYDATENSKDIGVFLPIANGGWIISKNAPRLDGLYATNREAAVIADRIGLDFIMSMSKWRGFGGETDHWRHSMDSLTMMAGLAEATTRVKVWATMHTLIHNPAVVAKAITTLDYISNGRAGLNIVAGAYREEFAQMGRWDDTLNHADRYDLAEEWITIIKRLWSQPSVDFQGKYFQMTDCQSDPKPMSRPRPTLIAAGQSDRGFEFATTHADACFISGTTNAERCEHAARARETAARKGGSTKVYAMCVVIHDETDAKAEARADFFDEGRDMGAILAQMKSWGVPEVRAKTMAGAAKATHNYPVIGSPATVREGIEAYIRESDLDGVMLIFPDYKEGLEMIGAEVLPGLRKAFA